MVVKGKSFGILWWKLATEGRRVRWRFRRAATRSGAIRE
jgi:hypothetical protein